MRQTATCLLAVLLAASAAVSGCARRPAEVAFDAPDVAYFQQFAKEVEYPDVAAPATEQLLQTPPPLTLASGEPPPYRDITLHEAVTTALTTAEVLRDLQGMVLLSPDSVQTARDPSLRETDPITGEAAALSEFDALFSSRAFFEKNDRALNNVFFGGGTRLLRQDLHLYTAEVSKHTAYGTAYALRHNVDYDFNNSPGNDNPNRPWDVDLEAEFRQPLAQGAGLEFNRIAGPLGTPGRLHGVLLARVNTDIALSDFEVGVRDFVSDVENAYWELYFAYRDLDARIAARDRALETWRRIHTLFVNGRRGGEAEKEAQAREQYFRLQEEVENALGGRILEHARYETFRGTGGVQATERRLRRLMGIAVSDGELLRPVDEPLMAKAVFDWNEVLCEALNRRPELRRQQWQIKRREMELCATKNFLKPRVDAVGRYRWRGLGHDLLDPQADPADRFDNAYQNMTGGDFQEWHVGVEMEAPLGFRHAHSAVRHAELALARERAVLDEQQREIVHDLSSAFADVDRTYLVAQTNYNRRLAAQEQLLALEAVYEDADQNEKTRLLDLLLDAQRRLADAETQYHRSTIEYMLAVKAVHLQKGSLLDYNEIYLAEGPWPGQAYRDASRREHRRGAPHGLTDYRLSRATIISRGPYCQDIEPAAENPPPPAEALPPPVAPGVSASNLRPVRLPAPIEEQPRFADQPASYAAPAAGPGAFPP